MKKTFLVFLVLTSTFIMADTADLKTANFVGEYKLIKTIKETENSFSIRGSKCRELLKISLSTQSNSLIIYSKNISKVGETLNWIDLNSKDGIETNYTEDLLRQDRFGFDDYLGYSRRTDLITTLKKEKNILNLKYEDVRTTFYAPKGKLVNVSECLYEQIN